MTQTDETLDCPTAGLLPVGPEDARPRNQMPVSGAASTM